jgi:SAM-dependent methyltransferase
MKMKPYFSAAEYNTIKYYDENACRYAEETVRASMEHLYEAFLSNISKGAKILDAGCGSGRDSLFFDQHGYETVAFDASEKMVQLSSKLIGKTVLRLSFDEISFKEEFDGVWASASLLHIPKKKILPILEKLKISLKEKGILYASFKYGNGERSINGRLFNNYTEEELDKIVKKVAGFKKIKIWKTEDVRAARKNEYWVNVMLMKGIGG